MIQQGQVFKLKAKSVDGQPLWAYRYRVEGRALLRPQVGGFASRAEAQKALRQVLNRAVAWGLLEFNPVKRGGCSESAAAAEGEAAVRVVGTRRGCRRSSRTGLRSDGDLRCRDWASAVGVVRPRAARRRPRKPVSSTCGGRSPTARSSTKTRLSTRAVPLQAKAVEALDRLPASANPILVSERAWRQDRLPDLRTQALAAGADQGRHRAGPRALRLAPHLRDVRAARRRTGVRGLALHRLEHRDDRPPLRPPRPRQPRARGHADGRAHARAGRGRCVDVERKTRKRAQQQQFAASSTEESAARGRSVDADAHSCRLSRQRKQLISRNDAKPSDGLEPSTPSLPCAQLMAVRGNGFGLSKPLVATGGFALRCRRLRPLCSINAPYRCAPGGAVEHLSRGVERRCAVRRRGRRGRIRMRRRRLGLGRGARACPRCG